MYLARTRARVSSSNRDHAIATGPPTNAASQDGADACECILVAEIEEQRTDVSVDFGVGDFEDGRPTAMDASTPHGGYDATAPA